MKKNKFTMVMLWLCILSIVVPILATAFALIV